MVIGVLSVLMQETANNPELEQEAIDSGLDPLMLELGLAIYGRYTQGFTSFSTPRKRAGPSLMDLYGKEDGGEPPLRLVEPTNPAPRKLKE